MPPHFNRRPARPAAGPIRAVLAVAALSLVLGMGSPAGALGQPVDPRDPSSTTTTDSKPSTTEGVDPSSTVAEEDPISSTTESPASAGGSSTRAAGADNDSDDGPNVVVIAGVGLVSFIIGLVAAGLPLGLALGRRKSPPVAPAPVAPGAAAPASGAGPVIGAPPSRDLDQVRQQRVSLIQSLISLRDQLVSEAQAAEVSNALAAAGVSELNPLGQPFDPAHHRAVDRLTTGDPQAHGRIVSVERLGYADGPQVVRQPEVVVAHHGSGA